MKRIINILIILCTFIFIYLVVNIFDIDCIFKSIFGIRCPGCGLTRAFRSILSGNLINATKYNILSIPIFISIIVIFISVIIDIILNRINTIKYIDKLFSKYYIFIIIILIITMIINNINKI